MQKLFEAMRNHSRSFLRNMHARPREHFKLLSDAYCNCCSADVPAIAAGVCCFATSFQNIICHLSCHVDSWYFFESFVSLYSTSRQLSVLRFYSLRCALCNSLIQNKLVEIKFRLIVKMFVPDCIRNIYENADCKLIDWN